MASEVGVYDTEPQNILQKVTGNKYSGDGIPRNVQMMTSRLPSHAFTIINSFKQAILYHLSQGTNIYNFIFHKLHACLF